MNKVILDPSRWVEKNSDGMYRFARLRVRDEEDAEDLVQDTIIAALQAKENFEGRSTEKTWLYGILKNKLMEHYRKIKNNGCELEFNDEKNPCDADFDGKGHWQALPFSWGINPEKLSEKNQTYQILSGCIDKLSPKFRQLYVLREIERIDPETICSEFDISLNNLWVMLHRSRNLLKKCIESHLQELR